MIVLIGTIFFAGPLLATGYEIFRSILAPDAPGAIHPVALVLLSVGIIVSGGSFVATLRRFFCTKCVNFSCPLNTVPKPIVNAYLIKTASCPFSAEVPMRR